MTMAESEVHDNQGVAARLRQQAEADAFRVTVHGHQEMVEENVLLDEVRQVLLGGTVVEDYPEHKRGPCGLVCGLTSLGRYVHVVCTTSVEVAVVITVYEPKPPKWTTPFERGKAR